MSNMTVEQYGKWSKPKKWWEFWKCHKDFGVNVLKCREKQNEE